MPRNKAITEAYLSCRSYLARAVACIVPLREIEDIVQEAYVRVVRYRTLRWCYIKIQSHNI
jgi:DNA-directed RNA polymerase specialized sigma24 family protein